MEYKFLLANQDSFLSFTVAKDKNGNDIKNYIIVVTPTKTYNLDQIKKGDNPRDLNDDKKIFNDIKSEYSNESSLFANKNGGSVVVFDGGPVSISPCGKWVEFSCDDDDEHQGHSDGQHSMAAVTESVNEGEDEVGNHTFTLHLRSIAAYEMQENPVQCIRDDATAWNERSGQKPRSEANLRGEFDDIKMWLPKCYEKNISFKENQKGTNGIIIPSECNVTQVYALLGAILPMAVIPGNVASLMSVLGWSRKGESLVRHVQSNIAKSDEFKDAFTEALKHTPDLLRMSDFIQEFTGTHLTDETPLLKVATKSQIKKDLHKRKDNCQTLFSTGDSISGAFAPQMLIPLIYGLFENTHFYENKEFHSHYTSIDMASIWLASAERVVAEITRRFEGGFQSTYKNRWNDFIEDAAHAEQTRRIIQNVINKDEWKAYRKNIDIDGERIVYIPSILKVA